MHKTAFSIYNASAGSGKTYTLVKEYLKIILVSKKPDAYRSILAITFTNKAVHEMKSRVIESLSEFSKEHPNEKAQNLMQTISQETGLSHNDIHTKSKSIIKNLIHNYAAFDISTIDKFTHKVIRSFAHDLKLPITFEISLDTESLLTEAVDAIIAKAGDDQEITKLLIDYTLEKTNDDKSWDVSRDIMETGKLILNENNREEIIHFNQKRIEDFIQIKKKLTQICNDLDQQSAQLAQEILLLLDQNGIDLKSFSRESFPNHIKYITENNPKAKEKKYIYFEDIAINKNAIDRDKIEELAPKMLQLLSEIYTRLERKFFYEAFLKNITPLSLLNTLSNQLTEIQKEKNILSITEFNKLINDQIQNQPAPFIYERIGEKYKHFFIDEFQDTSVMQWQNLIPLIDNALVSEDLEGERGSLLIVGDPKQSIYRWRGGKAEQFIDLSKENNPFINKDKKLFFLETNYRSFSEIISFNNQFFKFLSNKFFNDDYKDLYQNHTFQKDNDKKGGYVSISIIPKSASNDIDYDEENETKDQNYLHHIKSHIAQIIERGFELNDIAILTRNNRKATLIAQYLSEQNIPIVSSESLLISASSETQCIIHILRYITNKNNLEAKSNYLYYLAKNNQNKDSIHDFISTGMGLKNEKEFQLWLTHFDIHLNFENLRKKSLYESVEIIISKAIPFIKRNSYVQYFLDIVLEKEIKNQYGISEFLSFWDNKSDSLSIPSPENNNAIKIMTIHKSKGLEFPVVIFPFAEENYSQSKQEKMWLEADESIIGLPKALVAKNKSVESFGEKASLIFNQKEQESLLDNLNIVYVALTRAVEQLYIITSEVKVNKDGVFPNNLASFFVEYLMSQNQLDNNKFEYHFGDSTRKSRSKPFEQKIKDIPQRYSEFNPNSILIAQKESMMWGTKQQKAIEFGNLLHEILSDIKIPIDIELAVEKAIENGLIENTQKEIVMDSCSKIVFHPELTDFFNLENKVLTEKTIIQKNSNLIKPDRISINNKNEALLLDYKTGETNLKHSKQIEVYENALIEMGFKVIKKVLVYIGEEIKIIHL